MQGSPAPSGAPPIGVPAPSPYENLRKRPRQNRIAAAPDLDGTAFNSLHNHLLHITCSDPWHSDLYSAVIGGRLPYRKQEEALHRALMNTRAYPPGGKLSAMIRCDCCRRWIPPQAVGNSGMCIECFYGEMALHLAVQLPSSQRFSWAVKDADFGAHLEGSPMGKRTKRVRFRKDKYRVDDADGEEFHRRRFLGPDGLIREQQPDDRGFLSETVILPPDEPGSAETAA